MAPLLRGSSPARKGVPFHGAIGEDKTASSVASSQLPNPTWAREPLLRKARLKMNLRSATMPSKQQQTGA
jgi:hypothetical protein